ncbi:MAG: TrbI/VirB10 family protein [Bryobacteraceae bacterium]|nr:TrbI/VirB10 family protein [Bryobacteraceae bacterium]
MRVRTVCMELVACAAVALAAQWPAAPEEGKAQADDPARRIYTVPEGTKIPLQLINSVSTKTAAVGDRVYLQTAFPILSGGRIVIPPGSYVTGTVTEVKRGGRVKGRAELYIRFDSLTLPNGVTRDFRAGVHSLDAANPGRVDRTEGKVEGESNKSGDAVKVGEAAGWGTMIGGVASRSGKGAGIGAAAGAAAGLVGVLLTRGPDAILERGTTVEMVLDRTLKFEEAELEGLGAASTGPRIIPPRGAQEQQNPRLSRRPFP